MIFKEECWFLYGLRLGPFYIGRLKYHSKGTSGSVDFNWEEALNPRLIGWYHTHPGKHFTFPSKGTDHPTMRSWVYGVDRPMLCGIICRDEQQCWCFHKLGKTSIIVMSKMCSALVKGFFIGIKTSVTQISE